MSRNTEVLLVDDNQELLEIIQDHLEFIGYSVTATTRAREAIEKSMAQLFDIVITDFSMPEVDGLALIEALRKLKQTMPVILMSGYLQDDPLSSQLGPTIVLTKPITMKALEDEINRLLTR